MRRFHILLGLLAVLLLAWPFRPYLREALARTAVVQHARGQRTVSDRLREYGPAARKRLASSFKKAKVAYPPRRIVLLGLKHEKTIELYAAGKGQGLRYIRSYPILAASGVLGPKLREGDRQVPEGLYRINYLNPNSMYHLSMRVDYPNRFDREMAKRDKRSKLGGDIMIHGSNGSVGCLAMGDSVAEELFVLVADSGMGNVSVILSPYDFRKPPRVELPETPHWVPTLYKQIEAAVRKLPQAK
ncbi:MAG: L,D-transpeptidase family protein [Armatimonadota bacterium]